MKHIFIFAATAMLMGGCHHSHVAKRPSEGAAAFYGEKFDPAGAVDQNTMIAAVQVGDTIPVKFNAQIHETCAKAGCWMTVENPNGYPMYVFMKDHAFGVPLEGCKDLKCVVYGAAYQDTLSVKQLKHFAEDANKSQAEIDAITSPLPVVSVEALGVMIEGGKPAENHGHEGHDHEHGSKESH